MFPEIFGNSWKHIWDKTGFFWQIWPKKLINICMRFELSFYLNYIFLQKTIRFFYNQCMTSNTIGTLLIWRNFDIFIFVLIWIYTILDNFGHFRHFENFNNVSDFRHFWNLPTFRVSKNLSNFRISNNTSFHHINKLEGNHIN